MEDFYLIAEVTELFDSDGSVIIKSFSEFSERFLELEKVAIDFFGKVRYLEIENAEIIDNNIILKFRRFNSAEDIFFLLNKKLFIEKDQLISLPENVFFIHDLIGSEVYINSVFFGKLVDVLVLSSNDVYVIQTEKGTEILVPAVEEFIDKFDVDNKKMYLSKHSNIFIDEN